MRDDDFERTLQAGSRAVAETVRPRPAEAIRARGDQRRRRQAAGSVVLAIAVLAGGGAAYAGTRMAAPPPVSPPVTPGPGPSGTLPAPSSPPASSPPASSPPATSAPAVAQFLPPGPYADDSNNMPHYTIAVAYGGAASFQGGITFVFQDGRTESGGSYTATLVGGGRLTFRLSSGQVLAGSYRPGGFSLDGCGAALRWATQPALCQFSYQPGATA
ncbi:MAG TPA: hypothetical protein VFX25_19865 [Streptosporangiaceae bacterium]|nr:hypothetical protein [Streptosporangiaceae bacterium]